MTITTNHWQRFSSPQAPEMIARSLFGIDAQLAAVKQAQEATEPAPAEPPEPADTDVADSAVFDPDDALLPVPGESDDQAPAPR